MSAARDEKAALAAALFDDADALISRIGALEKALPESISNASRNVGFQLSQVDTNMKQLSQLASTLQASIQQHASVVAASEVAKAAATFRNQVAVSSTDEVRSQILPIVHDLRNVVKAAHQKRQSIFWPAFFCCSVCAAFSMGNLLAKRNLTSQFNFACSYCNAASHFYLKVYMKTYFYCFIFTISLIFSFATTAASAISITNCCDDELRRFNIVTNIDHQPINYLGVWDSESNDKDFLLVDKSLKANNTHAPFAIWLSFEEGKPIWHSFGTTAAETSSQTFLFSKLRHAGMRYERPTMYMPLSLQVPSRPYPVSSVSMTFRQQVLKITEVSTKPLATRWVAQKRPLEGFMFAIDEDLSRGTALWRDGNTLSGIVFDYDESGQPTWYYLSNCLGSSQYTCDVRLPIEDGVQGHVFATAVINMESYESWRVELTFRDYYMDAFWIQRRIRVVTQQVSTTRLMRHRQ